MSIVKQPASRTITRILVFIAKLGIAALLVVWLFTQRRLNLSLLTQLHLTTQSIVHGTIAIIAILIGLLIMSWRFTRLLRYIQFNITYWQAFALTFIGSFTGSILPGLIGGDVIKAIYLCRGSTHQRSEAISAVIVDRILGLYALMSLAMLALPIASFWHLTKLDQHIQLILITLWGGVTIGGLLIGSYPWARVPVFRNIHARLPASLRGFTHALKLYSAAPKLVMVTIFISIINHLLVVISFWMIGIILGDSLSFFGHIVINPLAMLLNAIPLAPGGVGITEGGFSLLYEYAGSPNGAVIAFLGRILQYTIFTLGGIPAILLLNIREISRDESDPASVSLANERIAV